MPTEAHPAPKREPDPEGLFYGLPEPEPEPSDVFRDLPEPDPEPLPRAPTGKQRRAVVDALASLVLADLDARRGGAP